MDWKALQELLVGKVFLIGLTFVDSKDNIVHQYQTSGTVKELTNEGILKFIRIDESDYQMPYVRRKYFASQRRRIPRKN